MTASPEFGQMPGWQAPPAVPATRHLYRSRTNRQFAGVCGGLAEYFGSDATAVRILTIILAVVTGVFPLLIAYLLAAIVVPDAPSDAQGIGPAPGAMTSPGRGTLVFGVLLVVFGAVALANELFRIDWDLLGPFGLIAVGALLVVVASRR